MLYIRVEVDIFYILGRGEYILHIRVEVDIFYILG